jgi:hypothetical protein
MLSVFINTHLLMSQKRSDRFFYSSSASERIRCLSGGFGGWLRLGKAVQPVALPAA